MTSLVEKARKTPSDRRLKKLSDEEVALIKAYLSGEINLTQMCSQIDVLYHNAGAWLLPRLKAAIQDGRISFK